MVNALCAALAVAPVAPGVVVASILDARSALAVDAPVGVASPVYAICTGSAEAPLAPALIVAHHLFFVSFKIDRFIKGANA